MPASCQPCEPLTGLARFHTSSNPAAPRPATRAGCRKSARSPSACPPRSRPRADRRSAPARRSAAARCRALDVLFQLLEQVVAGEFAQFVQVAAVIGDLQPHVIELRAAQEAGDIEPGGTFAAMPAATGCASKPTACEGGGAATVSLPMPRILQDAAAPRRASASACGRRKPRRTRASANSIMPTSAPPMPLAPSSQPSAPPRASPPSSGIQRLMPERAGCGAAGAADGACCAGFACAAAGGALKLRCAPRERRAAEAGARLRQPETSRTAALPRIRTRAFSCHSFLLLTLSAFCQLPDPTPVCSRDAPRPPPRRG